MTAHDIETAPIPSTVEPAHGAGIVVPLNRLKASPRNARKVKHSAASIEALAASIRAKGVLQAPVVEIERDGEGAATGNYLVTIGEGRRQALRMLVKCKAISRTHPVKVVVDTLNDAHEISLDENVTREAMHPADQFEAFRKLAEEKGYGPEEIGARFGVSVHVVRQRLRLGVQNEWRVRCLGSCTSPHRRLTIWRSVRCAGRLRSRLCSHSEGCFGWPSGAIAGGSSSQPDASCSPCPLTSFRCCRSTV